MVEVATKEDIFQKLKGIIAEKLHVKEEDITLDSSFTDDLGADSLDIIELIMQLENDFGIDIPDEDAQNITTVRQVVDYIAEQLGISEEE